MKHGRYADSESYASIHAKAAREASRIDLGRKLDELFKATHVVEWTPNKTIYHYGSLASCERFADDLGKRAKVRLMTDKERMSIMKHTKQAFGNP